MGMIETSNAEAFSRVTRQECRPRSLRSYITINVVAHIQVLFARAPISYSGNRRLRIRVDLNPNEAIAEEKTGIFPLI